MRAEVIAAIVMLVLIGITGAFAIWFMRKQKMEEEGASSNNAKSVSGKSKSGNKKKVYIDSRSLVKEVESIEDGVITTGNGRRFVAAITCRGMDFYNASAVEQRAVMQGYRQFCNILTEPITYRLFPKAIDVDSLKEKYVKRYQEFYSEYEMTKRELESAIAHNPEDNVIPELKNKLEFLEQKMFHLTEQLDAMTYYSSTDVVLDQEQEYVFDWRYNPSETDVPLTAAEIKKKAKAELDAIAARKTNALAAAGVKARMCTNSEIIDACRRNSKPITAEQYKQKHVEASSYYEDIIESASDEYFQEAINRETEQSIQNEMLGRMSSIDNNPELWNELDNGESGALFGSGRSNEQGGSDEEEK